MCARVRVCEPESVCVCVRESVCMCVSQIEAVNLSSVITG